MEKLFQIATTISTPLALGGLLSVIFFFIIKQMLAKDVFPPLTKSSAFNILKTIVDRLFVLALIAMLLGFAGYIIPILLQAIYSQKSLPQASSNEPPKFRVRYFDVEGYAIDFLMKGIVDEKMEKYLSGQPFIVPNEVFKEMKFLMGKFSTHTEIPHLIDKDHNYLEVEIKGKYLGIIDLNIDIESDQYTLSSIESESDWNFYWTGGQDDKDKYLREIKKRKINAKYFSFWKFADKKYLNKFTREFSETGSIRLYNFVTEKYLPPDFSIVNLNYFPCPTGVWMINLINRIPVLKVAVIENISKSQIEIGNFFLRKNSNEQLRTREEDFAVIEKMNIKKEYLFPLRMLASGEKILIPLDIYFKYNKWNKEFISNLLSKNNIPDEINKIKGTEPVSVIEESNRDDIPGIKSIPLRYFKEIINRKRVDTSVDKEFIYGTSISVEQVAVDGKIYPFRKNDEKSFVLYYSSEVGSCPYAYTYSPEIKQWISEGHILYGKSSKRREGWDSIKLKRFTGKVIIKENDPEVSFIDFLRIRVKTDDGKEEVLLPKQSLLRLEDQKYLKMKQGEQIEVEFDGFQEKAGSTFYLESKGYYEVISR
ncbi:hypothetical protein [Candidatus Electronema sp. JM]|uniref:hypothetical protein n=1 Tax=Candidatus Electronema sp. JM TaxID=3401571 RepID=UPI003AA933D9